MLPVRHGVLARRLRTSPGRNVERRLALAVHVADVIENTEGLVVGRLHENDPGAVAKQHGGRAILGVHDAAHPVRAAQQHRARGARLDHLRRHHEAVDEPRARGGKIEAPGVHGAELALDDGRGRRAQPVRRHRGDDDAVDGRGRDPAPFEAALGGGDDQVGGRARRGKAALRDAGARLDPRVGRVEVPLEVGVRIDVRRYVVARRGDCCPHPMGPPSEQDFKGLRASSGSACAPATL